MSRLSPHRIGETIAGRYRLISRLGEGGFGVAYRAWDQQSGVPIVLKMPLAKHLVRPVVLERFEREVLRLRQCSHPHIVPIIDDGHDDHGRPFLVMRFLPGGSLADRKKPVGPAALHRWLPAVASALDYIHGEGVLHRDIKPANIFFDTRARAYLGDFGIAKLADEQLEERNDQPSRFHATESSVPEESLTRTGSLIGTHVYTAPELFDDRPTLTQRADQYSLAVTVYEMLSGSLPVLGNEEMVREFHRTQTPASLSKRIRRLPDSLSAAVDRALCRSADDRFATCQEFAAAALVDVPFAPVDPSHHRFLCPACHRLVRVPQDFGGRSCRCPDCNAGLRVSPSLDALWRADEDPLNTSLGRRTRPAIAKATPLLTFECRVTVSHKRRMFTVLEDRGSLHILIGRLAMRVAGVTGCFYYVTATNHGIEFVCRLDSNNSVPTAQESAAWDFKIAWKQIGGVLKPAIVGDGEIWFDRKDGVLTRCQFPEMGEEDAVFQKLNSTFGNVPGVAFVYERTPLWKMLVLPVMALLFSEVIFFAVAGALLYDKRSLEQAKGESVLPLVIVSLFFVGVGAVFWAIGILQAIKVQHRHLSLTAAGKEGNA